MTFKQGESCLIFLDGKWQYAIYNKEDMGHLCWLIKMGTDDIPLVRVGRDEIKKDEGKKRNDAQRVEHDQGTNKHGIR